MGIRKKLLEQQHNPVVSWVLVLTTIAVWLLIVRILTEQNMGFGAIDRILLTAIVFLLGILAHVIFGMIAHHRSEYPGPWVAVGGVAVWVLTLVYFAARR
jgi:hypothetical protein